MKRVIAVIAFALALPAGAANDDWMQRVGQALGKQGMEVSGGVYQVSLPRTDLHVTLDGVELKPALALSSWLTFQKYTGGDALVMGDLVLTQEELGLVMQKLAGGAVEVTALHNDLPRTDPVVMYMHVTGHGNPVKLARALHDALHLSRTPLEDAVSGSTASAAAERIDLDTGAIDRALGRKGTLNAGVYQVSFLRTEAVTHNGVEIPPAMGVAIVINFQPTGRGKAAATGDFVLMSSEVTPVLRELRRHGIEVTALHNRMLNEVPRVFFMHFWANDDAGKVAEGLRAALAKVSVVRG